GTAEDLHGQGAEVHSARDGKEGLSCCKRRRARWARSRPPGFPPTVDPEPNRLPANAPARQEALIAKHSLHGAGGIMLSLRRHNPLVIESRGDLPKREGRHSERGP